MPTDMTPPTETQISKLKNCPFCGKSAMLSSAKHTSRSGNEWSDALAFVFCDGCGAQGQQCGNSKAAVEAWNGRV